MVKEPITHSSGMRDLRIAHGGCDQVVALWSVERISRLLASSREKKVGQKSEKVKISQRQYFCLFREWGHKGWFNASCQMPERKLVLKYAPLKVLKQRIQKKRKKKAEEVLNPKGACKRSKGKR